MSMAELIEEVGSDDVAVDLYCGAGALSFFLAAHAKTMNGGGGWSYAAAEIRKVEPPGPLELLFIDGDHTYEGAKADFDRWSEYVRPGGHLLFHDAVDAGGYGNTYPGIVRLRGEVETNPAWQRRPGAGSIAHFVKR